MSEQIGTVELLRPRIYQTESGPMAVKPGTYPVLRGRDGHVTLQLTGRLNDRQDASTERIGDGLFALIPGHDKPVGPVKVFPTGYWSPVEFADLLSHPVSTEGDPEQRLRFRLTENSDAR
jgi:hypothetical protein